LGGIGYLGTWSMTVKWLIGVVKKSSFSRFISEYSFWSLFIGEFNLSELSPAEGGEILVLKFLHRIRTDFNRHSTYCSFTNEVF
jgi:hypothetical protein